MLQGGLFILTSFSLFNNILIMLGLMTPHSTGIFMGNENCQKLQPSKLVSRIYTQTLSAGFVADVMACSIQALDPLNIEAGQSQTLTSWMIADLWPQNYTNDPGDIELRGRARIMVQYYELWSAKWVEIHLNLYSGWFTRNILQIKDLTFNNATNICHKYLTHN